MIDTNYAKAYAEIDVIIENILTDFITLIPQQFINFIKDNKQKDHILELDKLKPLHEQSMMDETKAILTIIYRDFLCSQEEKDEINAILLENDNKYNSKLEVKYEFDNIFNNNKKKQ